MTGNINWADAICWEQEGGYEFNRTIKTDD